MFQLYMSVYSYAFANFNHMFKAIGVILIIWFLSMQFGSSFDAFDDALTATFNAVEAAAEKSEQNLK